MEQAFKLKEPKTFDEQLQILKSRNMIVDNEEEAIKILKRTNYYRLTAYALQFKDGDNYNNKVSFETMYNLYKFDEKLRHLIMEILEGIEISLRTYMAYNLSIKYGPEAYTNQAIFKDIKSYTGYIDSNGKQHKGLNEEINLEISKNRKELFVKHHIKKYDKHFPIWVIVEIFSFGMLSRTYKNLKTNEQKEISKNCFNINNLLLESWLDNLSYVRNICAHYGRLYNKNLTIKPKIHNKYKKYNLDSQKIFVSILSIKELTKDREEWNIFFIKLQEIINDYRNYIDLNLIGFPENWIEILSKI